MHGCTVRPCTAGRDRTSTVWLRGDTAVSALPPKCTVDITDPDVRHIALRAVIARMRGGGHPALYTTVVCAAHHRPSSVYAVPPFTVSLTCSPAPCAAYGSRAGHAARAGWPRLSRGLFLFAFLIKTSSDQKSDQKV